MKYLYTKKGKLFGEIKYNKDVFTNYKKHFHCMLSLSIIEKGKLTVEYDTSDNVILQNNSIAIFNPNQLHCTTNIDAAGYYTLYLNIDWCKDIQNELFLDKKIFIPINKHIITYQKINMTIINIYNDISKNNNNYEEKFKNIIKNIFIKYCNTNDSSFIKNNNYVVYLMKKYIYNNLHEQLSINDISNYLGYDKSYLIRLFKKEIGITPQIFIINEKVHKAKELIKMQKNVTLLELALDAGFYDQSHLNRNFKKIFAINPKYYQNN